MISKSKGLLALACMGLLAVGTGALAVANKSSGQSTKNANLITGIQEKLSPITEGGMRPGNAFYLMDYTYDADTEHQWYVGNGRNVWAHFFQNGVDGKNVDVNMGNTNFYMDYDYHTRKVAECKVPNYIEGVTKWDRVIFVRVDADSDHIIWPNDNPNKASNQTPTIELNSNDNVNAVYLNSDSQAAYGKYISAAGRIERWAAESGDKQWNTGNLCQQDGSTDVEKLKASWDATEITYTAIPGDDVKAFFSNQTPVEAGTTCEQLAYRYDHILSKHTTWSNFAQR